jgi:hypothetical protein
MMVTMAYAVNEGPGARHVPGTDGSHDFLTCSRQDKCQQPARQTV